MRMLKKEYILHLNKTLSKDDINKISSTVVKTKGYSLIPSCKKYNKTIHITYSVENYYPGLFTTRFMPDTQLEITESDNEPQVHLIISLKKAYRIMLIVITMLLLVFQIVFIYQYSIGNFDLKNLFIPLLFIVILWIITVLFFKFTCQYYLKVFQNLPITSTGKEKL